jgi:hypothetical protein
MARRLRLQAAEADLAYLEAHAPYAIEQQRALVNRLRAGAGLPPGVVDSETIRQRVERRAKCRTVLA